MFPSTVSDAYWSASPSAFAISNAWGVKFSTGSDFTYLKSSNYYVRLVRGGQKLVPAPSVSFFTENLLDYSYQVGTTTKSWSFTNGGQPITGLKAVLLSADTGLGITGAQWQLGDVVANGAISFQLPVNPVHAGIAVKTAKFQFQDAAGNIVPISNSAGDNFWLKLRTNKAPAFSNSLLTSRSLLPGQSIALPLSVADFEGDPISCTVTGGGTISGACQYNGSFATAGVHSVTVTASDGQSSRRLNLDFVVTNGTNQPFVFTDVPTTSPNFAAIHYLALKGIVIGHPGAIAGQRQFLPNDLVNQAEALTILMRAAEQRGIITLAASQTEYANLRPLGSNGEILNFSWAAPYLDMAEELGIVTSPRLFDPTAKPTREWLAHVLVKLLALWNPAEVIVNPAIYLFTDASQFTTPALYDSARTAAFYGLIGTLNRFFNPQIQMTRESVAVVAAKILQMPLANGITTTLPSIQIDGKPTIGVEQGNTFQISGLSGLTAPAMKLITNQVSEMTVGAAGRTRAYVVIEGAGKQIDQLVSVINTSPLNLTANWNAVPKTLQKSLLVFLENVDANVGSVVRLPFWVTFTDSDGDGVQDKVDSAPLDIHHALVTDNHPPYVESMNLSTSSSQILSSSVSATDFENDPLTFSVLTPPVKGQFQIVNSALGIFTYTPNANASGIDTITVRATDSNGGTGQAIITVQVAIAPVITLKRGNITIAQGGVFTEPGYSAIANPGAVNLTANVVVSGGTVNTSAAVGTVFTLNYSVINAAGNPAAVKTRTVTIVDGTAPIVIAPANITIAATSASGTPATNAAIAAFLTGATATDNVGVVGVITNNAPAILPVGTTTVTFTATDAAGNQSIATSSVTVSAYIAPDITKPVIATNGANPAIVEAGLLYVDALATVTDNVDATNALLAGVSTVNSAAVGSYTVTYNASDVAGNAAVPVVRTVNVVDTTSPVLTLPADVVANALGLRTVVAIGNATATDLFAVTITNDAPADFVIGTTPVTWTATDANGRVSTGVQQVVVNAVSTIPSVVLNNGSTISLTAPVGETVFNVASAAAPLVMPAGISFPLGTLAYSVTSPLAGSVTMALAFATPLPPVFMLYKVDNAGVVTAIPASAWTQSGTSTINLTLTDGGAFDLDGLQNGVIVDPIAIGVDTQAPVIALTGANPITIAQGSTYVDAGTVVTDNVDTGLAARVTGAVNTATAGTYTLTYNVSDAAGNAATSVTRSVIVTDQTAPVIAITGANPVIIAQGSTYMDAGSTVSDNADAGLIAVVTGTVNTATVGIYTLTYNVSDAAGNAATSVTRSVIVTDQTAPVIALTGANLVIVAQGSTFTDLGSSVTDNVDAGLIAVVTGTVNTAVVGAYTLAYNVSDGAGNAATSVTRTVNVTDQTAPTVIAPTSITVAATSASGTPATNAAIAAFLTGATATDNVGVVGVITNNAPAILPVGTTTVTFTATDAAGNQATATSTVTVSAYIAPDTTKPVIAINGANPATVEAGQAYVDALATVTDNVDLTNAVLAGVSTVNSAAVGSYTVTYNASDTAGNPAIAVIRTVNVADTTNPVLTLPADVVANATGLRTVVAIGNATATDLFAVTITNDAPADFVIGTTPVTWTATDANGRVSTGVQQVTVNAVSTLPAVTLNNGSTVSITAPTGETVFQVAAAAAPVAIPAGISFPLGTLAYSVTSPLAGSVTMALAFTTPLPPVFMLYKVDNAGVVTVMPTTTWTQSGTSTINLTLTDGGAFDLDGLQNGVIVDPIAIGVDTQAPVIALIGLTTITVAQGGTFTDPGTSVTDNVDTALMAVVTGTVNTATVGTYTLTYNISDAAGNAATSVTRSVIVTDQTAPTVIAPTSITVAATSASGTPATNAAIAAFLTGATATDNVGVVGVITNNAPAILPVGTTTVTFTATDAAGNQATATSTVTVSAYIAPDTTKPVIAINGANPATVEAGQAYVDALATVTDNVDLTNAVLAGVSTVNSASVGSYTVTYNASDVAGNAAVPVVRTVNVVDTTSPVLTLPANVLANASGVRTVVAIGSATATDLFAVTITNNAPVDFIVGTTAVIWTATDANGRVSTGVQQVTVNVVSTLPAVTLNNGSTVSITAPTGETLFQVAGAAAPVAMPAGVTFPFGTLAYSVSSPFAGSVTMTLVFSTPLPPVYTLYKIDNAGVVTAMPASVWTQSGANTINLTLTDGGTFDLDGLQNGVIVDPIAIGVDTQAPVIALTGANPITVAQGGIFTDPGTTVTDNVDTGLIATVTGAVDIAVVGNYTLTYNVSDLTGNAATALIRTVHVTDQTAPVVISPANITVVATTANGTAQADAVIAAFLNGATATDNVAVVGAITNNAPITFPAGVTTIVTFTATDAAGNMGTATATVTAGAYVAQLDTTKPVITLLGSATVQIAQGAVYSDAGATASDNVDGNITANITVNNAVNSSVIGSYTVTYDVQDAAGNTAVQVVRKVNVGATALAPTVSTSVVSGTIQPGSSVNLPISITAGAGALVGAFNISVTLDSNTLTAINALRGDLPAGWSVITTISPPQPNGSVQVSMIGQQNTGVALTQATIQLPVTAAAGIANGTVLTIAFDTVNSGLFASDGTKFNATFQSGTLTVATNISQIYNLTGGWNLISFPMNLGTTGLADFLTAVPEATSVWTFVNGGWQSFIVGTPAFLNSLSLLDAGKGYWVQLPVGANRAVTLVGASVTITPNLLAGSGWNLIGVTTPVIDMAGFITSTGAASIWTFVGGQWQSFIAGTPVFLNSLQSMGVGVGYYVEMR